MVASQLMMPSGLLLIICYILVPGMVHSAFNHLDSVPEGSELSMELAPLLAAKKELGEGEGLADQLQVDQDLPVNERLEAVSNTILAWRQPNLSYSS